MQERNLTGTIIITRNMNKNTGEDVHNYELYLDGVKFKGRLKHRSKITWNALGMEELEDLKRHTEHLLDYNEYYKSMNEELEEKLRQLTESTADVCINEWEVFTDKKTREQNLMIIFNLFIDEDKVDGSKFNLLDNQGRRRTKK
jgi:hypothetical protein